MSIAVDLLDEHQALYNASVHWRTYWKQVAAYVLPQTAEFDQLLSTSPNSAIHQVATMPVAASRSKNIYDMTSIWAVERLTAGLISLKTPETSHWHDLDVDDLFGDESTYEEKTALERVRNFMFAVRANPKSGFWPAHKAAVRSMCAFGDGWLHIPEEFGRQVPWRYEYMPLPECNPGVDDVGQPNIMYRAYKMSAFQMATRWADKDGASLSTKTLELANDPTKRHTLIPVLHGVRPRSDQRRIGAGPGARGGHFESHYLEADNKHHIGEGGFYDFPFIRYAWSSTGMSAQSEGPVAYALAEIKSLNEMARNELIASQVAIRPPIATHGKNFGRINFNPGAVNHSMVNAEGKPLFAPMVTGARPDFAQSVLETRRNAVRETLYLNLWQILIESPDMTATEAMIRAQEKGELLGPVGISLSNGLASMADREIGIMGRRGAFDEESPLALPESLADRDVSPRWTSPLDRLRQMGELIGMQRLAEFASMLATALQDPSITQRLEPGTMLDKAREVLGAPADALKDTETVQEGEEQKGQMEQLMGMIQAAQGGGDALKSLGEGTQAAAAGAQVAQQLGGGQGAPAAPAPEAAPVR